MICKDVFISDFHLKRSVQFVQKASQFQSDIIVRSENGETANGKSILGLMSLNIHKKRITIEVKGPDERNALSALMEILEHKLNLNQ